MAAQFIFTKVRWRARAEIVDGASDKFLAGAGFAEDQHGGVSGRDDFHLGRAGV